MIRLEIILKTQLFLENALKNVANALEYLLKT